MHPSGNGLYAQVVIDLTGEDSDAEPDGRRPQRTEAATTLPDQLQRREDPAFEQPDATCTACDEAVRARDLVQLLGCGHKPKVCKACFTSWVKAQLDLTVSDSIKCPAHGCPYVIIYQDVQEYTNAEVLHKFDNMALLKFLGSEKQFQRCMVSGCNSGQYHTGGNVFICQNCGGRSCTNCNVVFHSGESCFQYHERIKRTGNAEERNKRAADEEQSRQLLSKIAKPCPKCQTPIEKSTGCDHMTCRQCRHEFCWVCFAAYLGEFGITSAGNRFHGKHCIHWSMLD